MIEMPCPSTHTTGMGNELVFCTDTRYIIPRETEAQLLNILKILRPRCFQIRLWCLVSFYLGISNLLLSFSFPVARRPLYSPKPPSHTNRMRLIIIGAHPSPQTPNSTVTAIALPRPCFVFVFFCLCIPPSFPRARVKKNIKRERSNL
jgi:hypothetical protein